MPVPSYTISTNRPRAWVNNANRTAFLTRVNPGGAWNSQYSSILSRANTFLGQSASQILDANNPENNMMILCLVGWVENNTSYYSKAIQVSLELVNRSQSSTIFTRIKRIWAQTIALDFCFNTMTGTERLTIFGDVQSTSVPSDKDDVFMGYETGMGQSAKFIGALIAHGWDNTVRDDLLDPAEDLIFGNGTLVSAGGTEPGWLGTIRFITQSGCSWYGTHYTFRNFTIAVNRFFNCITNGTDYNGWNTGDNSNFGNLWEFMLWMTQSESDPTIEDLGDTTTLTAPLFPDQQGWTYNALAGNYSTGADYLNWLYDNRRTVQGRNTEFLAEDILYNPKTIAAVNPKTPANGTIPSAKFFQTPGIYYIRHYNSAGTKHWDLNQSTVYRVTSRKYYHLWHQHRDCGAILMRMNGDPLILSPSGLYTSYGDNHHVNYYQRSGGQSGVPLVYNSLEKYERFGTTIYNEGGQQLKKWNAGTNRSSSRPLQIEYLTSDNNGTAWLATDSFVEDPGDANYSFIAAQIQSAYRVRSDNPQKLPLCSCNFMFIKPNGTNGLTHLALIHYVRVQKSNSSWRTVIPWHHRKNTTLNPNGWSAEGYYDLGKVWIYVKDIGNYTVTRLPAGTIGANGWGADQFKSRFGEGTNWPPGETASGPEIDVIKQQSVYVEPLAAQSEQQFVFFIVPKNRTDPEPYPTIQWFEDTTHVGVVLNNEVYKIHKTSETAVGPSTGGGGANISENLPPDGVDAGNDTWTAVNATTKVEAVTTNDTKYIESSTNNAIQRYTLASPSTIQSGDTITSVKIEARTSEGTLSENQEVAAEADGTQWTVGGTASGPVNAVNNDDDTSYMFAAAASLSHRYWLNTPTLFTASDTIQAVRIRVRTALVSGTGTMEVGFRDPAFGNVWTTVNITSTITTYLTAPISRPGGGAWTFNDLNSNVTQTVRTLIRSNGTTEVRVYRLQVVPEYKTASPRQIELAAVLSGSTTPINVNLTTGFNTTVSSSLARPGGGTWAFSDLANLEIQARALDNRTHRVTYPFRAVIDATTGSGGTTVVEPLRPESIESPGQFVPVGTSSLIVALNSTTPDRYARIQGFPNNEVRFTWSDPVIIKPSDTINRVRITGKARINPAGGFQARIYNEGLTKTDRLTPPTSFATFTTVDLVNPITQTHTWTYNEIINLTGSIYSLNDFTLDVHDIALQVEATSTSGTSVSITETMSLEALQSPRLSQTISIENPVQTVGLSQNMSLENVGPPGALSQLMSLENFAATPIPTGIVFNPRAIIGGPGGGTTTPFVNEHNWVIPAILETEFRTIIINTIDGIEERISQINRPLRRATFKFTGLTKEETAIFLEQLSIRSREDTTIPLFTDLTALSQNYGSSDTEIFCNTQFRRFFANGKVQVIEIDGSKVTKTAMGVISSVLPDRLVITSALGTAFAKNSLVTPVLDIEEELETPFSLLTDTVSDSTPTYTESPGENQIPIDSVSTFPSFKNSIPLFDFDPNWVNTLNVSIYQLGEKIPIGRGFVIAKDIENLNFSFGIQLLGVNRQSSYEIIQFINSRQGRLLPFWFISPATVFTYVSETATSVTIEDLNRPVDQIAKIFEFIAIERTNGFREILYISSIIDNLNGTWTINTLETITTSGPVSRLTSAHFCRFKEDTFREEWLTTETLRISVELLEINHKVTANNTLLLLGVDNQITLPETQNQAVSSRHFIQCLVPVASPQVFASRSFIQNLVKIKHTSDPVLGEGIPNIYVDYTTNTHNFSGWSTSRLTAPAFNFIEGREYLLITSSHVGESSTTSAIGRRVKHGSTVFSDSPTNKRSSFANVSYRDTFFWVDKWTAVNGEDITIEVYNEEGSTGGRDDFHTIIPVDLTGKEFYYNKNTTLTPSTTSYQNGATITFTPATAGKYTIIAWVYFNPAGNFNYYFVNLNRSGEATDNIEVRERLNGVDGILPTSMFVPIITEYDLGTASNTFTIQHREDTNGPEHFASVVFAIRQSSLQDFASQLVPSQTPLTSPKFAGNINTASLTTTSPRNLAFINWFIFNAGNSSDSLEWRAQLNNVDEPTGQTSKNWLFNTTTGALEDRVFATAGGVNSFNGSATWDMDVTNLNNRQFLESYLMTFTNEVIISGSDPIDDVRGSRAFIQSLHKL